MANEELGQPGLLYNWLQAALALEKFSFEALSYVWGKQKDMRKFYYKNHDYSEIHPEDIQPQQSRGLWKSRRTSSGHCGIYATRPSIDRCTLILCASIRKISKKRSNAKCIRTVIWVGEPDVKTSFVVRMISMLTWVAKTLPWISRTLPKRQAENWVHPLGTSQPNCLPKVQV